MRRLRWAMDSGGFWEMDMETPVTMEGTARPVPSMPSPDYGGGGTPLVPLGISRGPRLSRSKQLDFMHRFMSSPIIPSFSGAAASPGLVLSHADTFHLRENWSVTVMEQFQLQKFVSHVKERAAVLESEGNGGGAPSWIKNMARCVLDAYRFGFGTEFFFTSDSSVLVETYGDDKRGSRNKAIFSHKLPQHDLTLEASSPGLFVDKHGTYWDVPLSMSMDFASVASGSGPSYHLCLQHSSGQPKNFANAENSVIPPAILPGLSAKAAFSIKKNVDIWRKKGGKLKMVQPYDFFLSDPHVSTSGIIGSVVSASLGDNSVNLSVKDESRQFKAFTLHFPQKKSSLFADFFASFSCTVQHGNFQRLLFDLTRLHARLDFPSGLTSLEGARSLVEGLYNSQKPDLVAVRAICPDVTVSLQQQLVGPVSFRVESRLAFDFSSHTYFARLKEPVFALDYALQVLGSARATAWYSPMRQEAMVELRFFES